MNYLANYINGGGAEGITVREVDSYMQDPRFFPITQYPDQVNCLFKEIGCYLDFTYQVSAVRIYISEE